jgi:hypothetical protein
VIRAGGMGFAFETIIERKCFRETCGNKVRNSLAKPFAAAPAEIGIFPKLSPIFSCLKEDRVS